MNLTDELLARMEAGDSVETLTAELAKALNDAQEEHERIKAKRRENMKKQQKYDAAERLLDAARMIAIAWDLGDDPLNFIKKIGVDELTQELDEVIAAVRADILAMKKFYSQSAARPVVNPASKPQKLNPDDDPIQAFLDQFVRS